MKARNNGKRFAASAGMLTLGVLLGFVLAHAGSPAAGAATPQQVTPAAMNSAPALDQYIPQNSFVEVVERAEPALVFIRAEHEMRAEDIPQGMIPEMFRRWLDEQNPDQDPEEIEMEPAISTGSGFIFDPEGYILTNAHVISRLVGDTSEAESVRASEVTVRVNDDDEYEAEIVGLDIGTDVAVLKIDAGDDLPYLPFGNSDEARVGEWVMAMGAPFGLTNTVTAGIISAKGRATLTQLRVQGGNFYQDYIQTDASINVGNSGGPLLNLRGEVIGMNTAIVGNGFQQQFAGVGFAVPINLVSKVKDQLIANGRVIRGWIGVTMGALTDDLAEGIGVADRDLVGLPYIVEVNPGEPADLAGVQYYDIVIAMDGLELDSDQDLLQRIALVPPGETITLRVLRGMGDSHEELDLELTLGERPPEEEIYRRQFAGTPRSTVERRGRSSDPESMSRRLGMTLTELTPDNASQLGHEGRDSGVVVREVSRAGAARRAGLVPGDLILEVRGEPIATIEELELALEAFGPGEVALLRVLRTNGQYVIMGLRIPEE